MAKKKMAKKKIAKTKAAVKKKTQKAAPKRKAAKTPVKKSVQKTAKRPARKPARKAARKPGAISVQVTPALEARLNALAANMSTVVDALLVQALTEFVETWEDHQRTVAALNDGSDRLQVVAPTDEAPSEPRDLFGTLK
jgi:predicted transcriptional regulator